MKIFFFSHCKYCISIVWQSQTLRLSILNSKLITVNCIWFHNFFYFKSNTNLIALSISSIFSLLRWAIFSLNKLFLIVIMVSKLITHFLRNLSCNPRGTSTGIPLIVEMLFLQQSPHYVPNKPNYGIITQKAFCQWGRQISPPNITFLHILKIPYPKSYIACLPILLPYQLSPEFPDNLWYID